MQSGQKYYLTGVDEYAMFCFGSLKTAAWFQVKWPSYSFVILVPQGFFKTVLFKWSREWGAWRALGAVHREVIGVAFGVPRNIINDSMSEDLMGDMLTLNVAKCNKNQQYGVVDRSIRCGARLLCLSSSWVTPWTSVSSSVGWGEYHSTYFKLAPGIQKVLKKYWLFQNCWFSSRQERKNKNQKTKDAYVHWVLVYSKYVLSFNPCVTYTHKGTNIIPTSQ